MSHDMIVRDEQAIRHFLTRGVQNVYPSPEVFTKELLSGRRLTVYLGIDPTGPTLHLGHIIALRKLAQMQRLGHKVILLIGDFTAMIGDPTDKMAVRKPLTREDVLANCAGYREQAKRLIAFDGPNAAEMKFNSEWLAPMSFADVVRLAAHFTVQQMLERDMFEKRLEEGKPVHLHEFLYPLMQGYDSVAMGVDLEIGGNDQTFNMLTGRTLLKEMKGKEKFVLTAKLLVDPTGKKMGKSEGNMVALTDSPEDMYGKVMSWIDGMIISGFELLTDVPSAELDGMDRAMADGENPMTYKRRLAWEVVASMMSSQAADGAQEHFNLVHQQHAVPEDIAELVAIGGMTVVDVLVGSGLVPSKTEARRQIEQGAVKLDGEPVSDPTLPVKAGCVIQKGKRHFVRLV